MTPDHVKAQAQRARDLQAQVDARPCTNPYCNDGWVRHGDGVSFGSWPCQVCKRRVAA